MFTAANGDRTGVPNFLVLVTDGMSDNATVTWAEAMRARDMGITIIAVRTRLIDSFTAVL